MKTPLILVNSVGVLVGASYGMHGPILPVFARDAIGASYADLGLIGLANFVPYMFIPILVGILLDRYNNGYLLSVGVAINAASIYLLSVAQTVPEVMAFRVMTGVAHAFFWPPCESIISSISKGRQRVGNLAKFTGFFVAGFTIGPLAGSFLLEGLDIQYRMLFQVAAFVVAAAIVASMSLSRRRVRMGHLRFSLSSTREIVRFPEIIAVLVYCTASFGIILAIYPAFLDDNSVSAVQIEVLYFAFGASRIATLVAAGVLARRTGLTLTAAVLSIVAGLLISFWADTVWWFALAMITMGFGFGIFAPLTLEVVLSRTKKEISGTIIGAYETTFGMGWAIGPVAAGLISQFHGGAAPYLIFAILGAGVAVLCVLKKGALEPQRRELPDDFN